MSQPTVSGAQSLRVFPAGSRARTQNEYAPRFRGVHATDWIVDHFAAAWGRDQEATTDPFRRTVTRSLVRPELSAVR